MPLGEDVERYEVDVLSAGTVLRTLAATAPAALYDNAAELADFGVPQDALSLRVAQLGATVGRGTPAEATLTIS